MLRRTLLPPALRLAPLVCLLVGALPMPQPHQAAQAAVKSCQFLSSPGAVPAFCDTFDAPAGTGNRSGDINGTVWGVSRVSGQTNPTQGQNDSWYPVQENQCGTTVTVRPEADMHICNGQLVEATNDGGNFTTAAMYPTQPFDIAGRTGTVVFDVNADAFGAHAAWPAFVYSDQPVPVPTDGGSAVYTYPRNGFGFTLNLGHPCGANTSGIDAVWASSTYDTRDLSFTPLNNCVTFSSGALNHFEVRVSQSQIDVYGTDAGSSALKHMLSAPNAGLTLTRGLVWIEDQHYNGDKDGGNQSTHTFSWDNVGFDGPVLPGDVHLDVNDANDGPDPRDGSISEGWGLGTGDTTLTISGVTGASLAAASGAILTLSYYTDANPTLRYQINGNPPHSQPWPFADTLAYAWRTLAVPVPLADLVPGNNIVRLSVSSGADAVANVDLILIGARDTGGGTPTDTPVPTSTGTATNTATPAPPTDTPTIGDTSTNTPIPPTATNTPIPPTPTRTNTPLPGGGTLGYTQLTGGALDTGNGNNLSAVRVKTGASPVTVSSLSVYVGPIDAAHPGYGLAIYKDGGGHPGARLTSAAGALSGPGWNSLSLTASLAANTTYWLAYNSATASQSLDTVYLVRAGGVPGGWSGTVSCCAFPASTAWTIVTPYQYAIYATTH